MNRKICVLDDDPVTLRLVSGLLGRDHSSVETFAEVETARAYLQAQRPEILVLDMQLPGFSGVEVLEWARDLNPFLRVVVITGEAPVTSLHSCWRLGADCCVLKGDNFPTQLTHAVQRASDALELWETSVATMRQHHRRAAAAATAATPNGVN